MPPLSPTLPVFWELQGVSEPYLSPNKSATRLINSSNFCADIWEVNFTSVLLKLLFASLGPVIISIKGYQGYQ